ncbi:hypothetical protein Sjap_024502 [Stephania japonica]|uniref:Uncharacterized protein n=1 Tax=Stephania japonica TaxID=461633 RepID=A0AAP0EFN6_9MAGN
MSSEQKESRRLDMKEFKKENKVLMKDVDSIKDPILRMFFISEQTRILRKRAGQEGSSIASSDIDLYLNDILPLGANLRD